MVKPIVHTDAGRAAAHREYEQLPEAEQREIAKIACQHWSLNLNR